MHFITDFGDSAVTSVLAAMMAVYLLFSGNRRAAGAVVLSYTLSVLMIVAGKVMLYSRCDAAALPDLKSPSGHTAVSVAVYGIAAIIIASSARGGKYRSRIFFISGFLTALIAVSRLVLGVHTLTDVLIGLCVGLVSCVAAWRLLLRGKQVDCYWPVFFLILAATVAVVHGQHFPAEEIIRRFSAYINKLPRRC